MDDTEIKNGEWKLLNPEVSPSTYLLEFGKKTAVMFDYIPSPVEFQSRFCLTDYHSVEGLVLFYPETRRISLIGKTSYILSSLYQIGEAPGLPQDLKEGLELLLNSLR